MVSFELESTTLPSCCDFSNGAFQKHFYHCQYRFFIALNGSLITVIYYSYTRILAASFQQRRKMLRSSLRGERKSVLNYNFCDRAGFIFELSCQDVIWMHGVCCFELLLSQL